MTSISAGHIILTPTQPVGSRRSQRGSNPGPPDQESRALPTELPCAPPPPPPLFPLQQIHFYWSSPSLSSTTGTFLLEFPLSFLDNKYISTRPSPPPPPPSFLDNKYISTGVPLSLSTKDKFISDRVFILINSLLLKFLILINPLLIESLSL